MMSHTLEGERLFGLADRNILYTLSPHARPLALRSARALGGTFRNLL